jgi:fermentation-respiration switch protein FrsA (DUF1100 family)
MDPGCRSRIQGTLGEASAPMLLVNGEKDTQVPIEDLYLLSAGLAPREAWVNPEGGRIGRGEDWSDGRILNEVLGALAGARSQALAP